MPGIENLDIRMDVEDAFDLLYLYHQDFVQRFGSLEDGLDKAVLDRRVEAFYGQTALGWIASGEQIHPGVSSAAWDAVHDMQPVTRVHLRDFLRVMKDELPTGSRNDARILLQV